MKQLLTLPHRGKLTNRVSSELCKPTRRHTPLSHQFQILFMQRAALGSLTDDRFVQGGINRAQ